MLCQKRLVVSITWLAHRLQFWWRSFCSMLLDPLLSLEIIPEVRLAVTTVVMLYGEMQRGGLDFSLSKARTPKPDPTINDSIHQKHKRGEPAERGAEPWHGGRWKGTDRWAGPVPFVGEGMTGLVRVETNGGGRTNSWAGSVAGPTVELVGVVAGHGANDSGQCWGSAGGFKLGTDPEGGKDGREPRKSCGNATTVIPDLVQPCAKGREVPIDGKQKDTTQQSPTKDPKGRPGWALWATRLRRQNGGERRTPTGWNGM